MALYNRRMNMRRMPRAEVVHIDPPKPALPQEVIPVPARPDPRPQNRNFLKGLLPEHLEAEDFMLLGLILLFLNNQNEEYNMMLPALLYIFLG